MRLLPFIVVMGCRGPDSVAKTSALGGLASECLESGAICTLMGTGEAGQGDRGRAASQFPLYMPQDVGIGPDGGVVVVDAHNHRIVRLESDWSVSVVAGTGRSGDGPEGPNTEAGLSIPTSVAFDDQGAMWIAAWQNSRLARVDFSQGTLTFPCGTGERGYSGESESADVAVLDLPVSVAAGQGGSLFFFDQANQMVRVVQDDRVEDVAGVQRMHGYSGDGGALSAAQFHATTGQTAGPANKIDVRGEWMVVADTQNQVVRQLDLEAGTISTLAGRRTCSPQGECKGVDVVGDGAGPADEVGLRYPVDVAIGADGAVYVADTFNHCIRVVRDGWSQPFAGTCGVEGYDGDQGPADEALLSRPEGVTVDGEGNVYIADTYNHVIRVVHP